MTAPVRATLPSVCALARWLSLLLTLAPAACAVLVLLPAPVKRVAFLAIVVDEKTYFLIAAALLGALLARVSQSRAWIVLQLVLAVGITGVALLPPGQALRHSSRVL